jgi:antitoxin HicB
MERTLESYLSIDYPINLKKLCNDVGGGWLAEHPDLKGCVADGASEVEAIQNLKEVRELWLLTALTRNITIPMPNNEVESFSGKLTLRMPKSLHMTLTSQAKREGVSLNKYIVYLITNLSNANSSITDKFL